jgi:hypothetical protein
MQEQLHDFQQLQIPSTLSIADLDGLSMIRNLHPTIGPSRLPVHKKRMRESTLDLAARKRGRESTPDSSARQQARTIADSLPLSDARSAGDPTFDKSACQSTPDLIARQQAYELADTDHESKPDPEYAPTGITLLPPQTILEQLQRPQ